MSKTTTSNATLRHTKLKDSFFVDEITLVVGPVAEAKEYIKRIMGTDEHPSDGSAGESISSDDGTFIIWLEDHDGSPYWDGVLAHEIVHTMFDVLTYVGIKHCGDSEEVFSHYAGSLMNQAKKFLNKKK